MKTNPVSMPFSKASRQSGIHPTYHAVDIEGSSPWVMQLASEAGYSLHPVPTMRLGATVLLIPAMLHSIMLN
jgi:hypothetical protein